jgi:hypothetical protein
MPSAPAITAAMRRRFMRAWLLEGGVQDGPGPLHGGERRLAPS